MSSKIAVVIPYYQEQPGILRRAVASACAQVGLARLEVIVVDDGAPVPARDELRDLVIPPHVALRILEQENAGPGSARNRALDNLAEGTRYVAFLDSDDEWVETHLQNALEALGRGFDFYFANGWDELTQTEFFTEREFATERHAPISEKSPFRRYQSDARYDLIASRSFIHASTVVYRYESLSDLRFPEAFRMGEDLAFWIAILTRTDRLVFSPLVECASAVGYHLYSQSWWGNPRFLLRAASSLAWRSWVQDHVRLGPEELDANGAALSAAERGLIAGILHDLIRGRTANASLVAAALRRRPRILLRFLPVALGLLTERVRRHGRDAAVVGAQPGEQPGLHPPHRRRGGH